MIAVDAGGGLHVSVEEFGSTLRREFSHFADVGLGEFESAGVHKACPDEGAGLASALAVILLINEAAVVAEILVEVATRTGEDLPKVDGGDLTDICPDLVADLEDLAEDEDEALAAVQAKKGPDEAVVSGLLIQDFDGDRHGARVRRIEVGDLAEPSGSYFKGTDGIAGVPLGFPDAQEMVDGDSIEPSAEPCLSAKLGESFDGFEQDLLSGVFSVGAAMEHANREVEDPWEVRCEH